MRYKRSTSTETSFAVLSCIQIDQSSFQYKPVNMLSSGSVTFRVSVLFRHQLEEPPNRQDVRRFDWPINDPTSPYPLYFTYALSQWRGRTRSRSSNDPPLSTPLATQLFSCFRVPRSRPDDGPQRPKHVVLQLRFTHISCNKLVCNSCLVGNLNSYIYLLCSTFSPSYFNTLISTTGMIHLNNK